MTGNYTDSSGQASEAEVEDTVQQILDVLDDVDCRAILDATSDSALSANEVSEACDLPLSTTYRKLELLTDAGLLEERTRICRSGKHPSEYARSVASVVISLDTDGETELQVSHRGSSERVQPLSR